MKLTGSEKTLAALNRVANSERSDAMLARQMIIEHKVGKAWCEKSWVRITKILSPYRGRGR